MALLPNQLCLSIPGRTQNKSMKTLLFFLGALIASLANMTQAQSPENPSGNITSTTHQDLRYGEHAAQKLDLYQPSGATKAPVMVYIHGGSWKRGDKRAVGEKPEFFGGKGWLFVSINYRLLPEGAHPVNVNDVAKALAWIHDHVEDYGGDPGRLFLMGHSAGAHLAALAGTDARRLQKHGKDLSILKGVIPLDTNAYDIPALMKGRSSGFYRTIFGTDPETWKDASPFHQVAAGKDIPPFLIGYTRGMGKTANPSRPLQAKGFADRLRSAGVEATVIDASDRNHGEINQWFGKEDDEKVTAKAWEFLQAIAEPKSK